MNDLRKVSCLSGFRSCRCVVLIIHVIMRMCSTILQNGSTNMFFKQTFLVVIKVTDRKPNLEIVDEGVQWLSVWSYVIMN